MEAQAPEPEDVRSETNLHQNLLASMSETLKTLKDRLKTQKDRSRPPLNSVDLYRSQNRGTGSEEPYLRPDLATVGGKPDLAATPKGQVGSS